MLLPPWGQKTSHLRWECVHQKRSSRIFSTVSVDKFGGSDLEGKGNQALSGASPACSKNRQKKSPVPAVRGIGSHIVTLVRTDMPGATFGAVIVALSRPHICPGVIAPRALVVVAKLTCHEGACRRWVIRSSARIALQRAV